MATRKYVSLNKLSAFLDKLKDTFASLTHTHSYDELRNKPFYEGTDYSSVFASTVNFYEWGGGVYGAAVTDAPKVLTQSISHKVIWDGVEYTITSAFAGNNDAGNPITSIGAPYGDYSNYPFGIDSYQTASGTYEFSIHTNSTTSTHTIDILELGSSFVTIDDRFISDNIARTLDVDTAIENLRDNTDKVANALKGYAKGESVTLTDVSPLEHEIKVKLTSESTSAAGTVTLLNGVSYDYADLEERDYIVSYVDYDGAYDCEVAWIEDSDIMFFGDDINSDNVSSGDIIRVKITYIEADEESGIDEEWINEYYLVKQEGTDSSQLDFTTVTLTRYGETSENNLKTYTPNEDGTVEGVTSLYPITTLSTDTDGVTIEVEYNKDIDCVNDILNTVEDLESAVVDADEKASLAQNDADDAKNIANDAKTTASTALSKANDAKTTASNALSKANNADTTASEALSKADTALTTANNAQTVADNALDKIEQMSNPSVITNVSSGSIVTMTDASPLAHEIGVKLASKNLCQSLATYSNVTINDGVITQITADSSNGWIKCVCHKNDTYVGVLGTGTKALGIQSVSFEKDDTFNQVCFGIGGIARDTLVRIDVSNLPNGTYTISGNFTNIEQGYISWKDMQIEKGTTASEYTPYVDLSSITLTKCGKNLIDISQMTNGCLMDNGDGTFTYKIINSNIVYSTAFPIKLKAGMVISSRAEIISSQNNTEDSLCFRFLFADGDTRGCYANTRNTTIEKDVVGIEIYSYENDVADVTFVFKEWQIELGDTTEYEPFKAETYTLNADGTVDGVTSFYPTTTLLTNVNGVIITAEYIKNVNEALNIEPSNEANASVVVGANISDVLRYTKQNLTDAQKAQIIENLGLTDYIQSMIQNYLDTTIAEEASW